MRKIQLNLSYLSRLGTENEKGGSSVSSVSINFYCIIMPKQDIIYYVRVKAGR